MVPQNRNYKSPPLDFNRKYSERRDEFEKMLNPMGSGLSQPRSMLHNSEKAGKLYDNLTVQRLPYQRNSKLNELFGDVHSHYHRPLHE